MSVASSQTNFADGRQSMWKWSGLSATSGSTVGDWVAFADFADRTVFTNGTFGAGGTLTWQGSPYNTSDAVPFSLHDPGGTALSSTIAVAHPVAEGGVTYIRPAVTAGSSTISIDGYLFGRKNPI